MGRAEFHRFLSQVWICCDDSSFTFTVYTPHTHWTSACSVEDKLTGGEMKQSLWPEMTSLLMTWLFPEQASLQNIGTIPPSVPGLRLECSHSNAQLVLGQKEGATFGRGDVNRDRRRMLWRGSTLGALVGRNRDQRRRSAPPFKDVSVCRGAGHLVRYARLSPCKSTADTRCAPTRPGTLVGDDRWVIATPPTVPGTYAAREVTHVVSCQLEKITNWRPRE